MKVDCMIVDDEEISQQILERYIKKTTFLNLRHTCSSAIDAANILAEENIDILFLDVEMPEMTGLDLLKTLDEAVEVILVTSARDYAADAYDESVTDYLVKPIEYARFLKAASKGKENVERRNAKSSNNEHKHIYVKTDSKLVKVTLAQILYIEALADYVIINTQAGNKYIVHSTMKGIEKRLPDQWFSRVHRSYIVNLDHIDSLEDQTILIGKKIIPIGASFKESFMSRLNFL